jgi:hypothetical protein
MIKIIAIILAFGLGYMTASNELFAYLLQEVKVVSYQSF